MRKGMGKGKGSGWKNLRHDDSMRHSMASKGIKTAQKVPIGYKETKFLVPPPPGAEIPTPAKFTKISRQSIIDNPQQIIEQMPITEKEKDLLKMVGLTYYETQNQWSADRINGLNAETFLSRYYDITKPRAKKILINYLDKLENITKR